MSQIVIATHGTMAEGVKSSLSILLGDTERVHVVNAYVGDEEVALQLQAILDSLPAGEQILVFTDLFGGSVNQIVSRMLQERDMDLIAGFNLAAILEFSARGQQAYTKEEIREILQEARQQMRYVNDELNTVREEAFF